MCFGGIVWFGGIVGCAQLVVRAVVYLIVCWRVGGRGAWWVGGSLWFALVVIIDGYKGCLRCRSVCLTVFLSFAGLGIKVW